MSFTLLDKQYKGHRLRIISDDNPPNPRKMFDNFGTMVCWHSRYNLGDEHQFGDPSSFMRELAAEADPKAADRIEYWETEGRDKYGDVKSEAMIDKAVDDGLDNMVFLPLYLYDHSGITMSCSPFPCRWDSGQVGYIYATREMILKEYGGKCLTKYKRERAEKLLRAEVEEYDMYLTGDVWGYIVEHEETGWEDSCWGFFGDEHCEQAAKDDIDAYCEPLREEQSLNPEAR